MEVFDGQLDKEDDIEREEELKAKDKPKNRTNS